MEFHHTQSASSANGSLAEPSSVATDDLEIDAAQGGANKVSCSVLPHADHVRGPPHLATETPHACRFRAHHTVGHTGLALQNYPCSLADKEVCALWSRLTWHSSGGGKDGMMQLMHAAYQEYLAAYVCQMPAVKDEQYLRLGMTCAGAALQPLWRRHQELPGAAAGAHECSHGRGHVCRQLPPAAHPRGALPDRPQSCTCSCSTNYPTG